MTISNLNVVNAFDSDLSMSDYIADNDAMTYIYYKMTMQYHTIYNYSMMVTKIYSHTYFMTFQITKLYNSNESNSNQYYLYLFENLILIQINILVKINYKLVSLLYN